MCLAPGPRPPPPATTTIKPRTVVDCHLLSCVRFGEGGEFLPLRTYQDGSGRKGTVSTGTKGTINGTGAGTHPITFLSLTPSTRSGHRARTHPAAGGGREAEHRCVASARQVPATSNPSLQRGDTTRTKVKDQATGRSKVE